MGIGLGRLIGRRERNSIPKEQIPADVASDAALLFQLFGEEVQVVDPAVPTTKKELTRKDRESIVAFLEEESKRLQIIQRVLRSAFQEIQNQPQQLRVLKDVMEAAFPLDEIDSQSAEEAQSSFLRLLQQAKANAVAAMKGMLLNDFSKWYEEASKQSSNHSLIDGILGAVHQASHNRDEIGTEAYQKVIIFATENVLSFLDARILQGEKKIQEHRIPLEAQDKASDYIREFGLFEDCQMGCDFHDFCQACLRFEERFRLFYFEWLENLTKVANADPENFTKGRVEHTHERIPYAVVQAIRIIQTENELLSSINSFITRLQKLSQDAPSLQTDLYDLLVEFKVVEDAIENHQWVAGSLLDENELLKVLNDISQFEFPEDMSYSDDVKQLVNLKMDVWRFLEQAQILKQKRDVFIEDENRRIFPGASLLLRYAHEMDVLTEQVVSFLHTQCGDINDEGLFEIEVIKVLLNISAQHFSV